MKTPAGKRLVFSWGGLRDAFRTLDWEAIYADLHEKPFFKLHTARSR